MDQNKLLKEIKEKEEELMGDSPGRSSSRGLVKEEKRDNSNGDEEGRRGEEIIAKVGSKRKGLEVDLLKPSPPKQKDFSSSKVAEVNYKIERSSSSTEKDQDDHKLESAKAEMGEVREENQRLKMYLERIIKDYQTLQMKFHDIVQQESKKSTDTSTCTQPGAQESEFVSLSLGRTSSTDSKKLDEKNTSRCKLGQQGEEFKHSLALGLDSKFEVPKMRSPPHEALPNPIISPENSSFEEPREEASETNWPPSKMLKTLSSGDHIDEVSQPNNTVKKARVSVRARCDTPTMNDGCQWRKYGQKIAKGNPCPRAYYRCTVAPSCPVRKQVQRCAQDMSILITTYEGAHNHPLPIAATAMASTTAAAASMLLSGSSSSRPGLIPSASTTATTTTAADQLHGLNSYLSENSKPNQFYFPNTSISSSPSSYPTITLDLTTPSSSTSSSLPFSSHFNRLSSTYPQTPSFSSLNFSSLQSNTLPISWSNGHLTHGNTTPSYNKNTNNIASIHLGTRESPQESNFYQPYMQKNHHPTNNSQQSLVPDTNHSTIAAATKAIASDPTFQSALAAALTSIIGASPGNLNRGGLGDNLGEKRKWGEQFLQPGESSYQPAPKGNVNGCGSIYLNNKPGSSSNPQPVGSMMFLPAPSSSLPFSSPKSASKSPDENRDHSN